MIGIEYHKKQAKKHHRAIYWYKIIDKATKRTFDLDILLARERQKRYVESFLLTPESEYLRQIQRCKKITNWAIARINKYYE